MTRNDREMLRCEIKEGRRLLMNVQAGEEMEAVEKKVHIKPVQQADNLKSVNVYSSLNPWFIHTDSKRGAGNGNGGSWLLSGSQGRCCLAQIQRRAFYRASLYAWSRYRPLINSHAALPSRAAFTLQMAVWPSGTPAETLWLLKSSFGSICVLKGGVD